MLWIVLDCVGCWAILRQTGDARDMPGRLGTCWGFCDGIGRWEMLWGLERPGEVYDKLGKYPRDVMVHAMYVLGTCWVVCGGGKFGDMSWRLGTCLGDGDVLERQGACLGV